MLVDGSRYRFGTDWDNTFVWGPSSIKAARAIHKDIALPYPLDSIPSIEDVSNQATGLGIMGFLLGGLSPIINSPRIRLIRQESIDALDSIDRMIKELHIDIKTMVLSGRSPAGHAMLLQQLSDPRIAGRFDEILLNPGIGSYAWKEIGANHSINKGEKLVYFDDDWIAMWIMSQLNLLHPEEPRFLGYLLENSSHRKLPQDKRNTLRDRNVYFVPNMITGVVDFGEKVGNGEF